MSKAIRNVLLFAILGMYWGLCGLELIRSLAVSTPEEIFVWITPDGIIYTAAGIHPRAREAAVALLGPTVDKSALTAKAAEISAAWDSRPQLAYADSCRHEAAHAITVHHFGGIVLSATVFKNGNGNLRWAQSTDIHTDADHHWMALCINIAGNVLDHMEGRQNSGSHLALHQVPQDILALISTGDSPQGFTSELTIENVMSAARAQVREILTNRMDTLNDLAGQLESEGSLPGHKVTSLLQTEESLQGGHRHGIHV